MYMPTYVDTHTEVSHASTSRVENRHSLSFFHSRGNELGAGNVKESETVSSDEKLPVHSGSQVCD